MGRKNVFVGVLVVLLIVGSWLVHQKMTDETYLGMSIIPEQHEDIPLYKGLEPTRTHYVIEGDHWQDIYEFYFKELPSLGWVKEYSGSALDDNDSENDWGGFDSSWTKEGFVGELSVSASYNQFEDQTEVMFDQTPIHHATKWINEVPDSLCVYDTLNEEGCVMLDDHEKIQKIVGFINDAIDWEGESPKVQKTGAIVIGDKTIEVLHGDEIELYFQSEMGLKLMKAEPEFFEMTGLKARQE